MDHCLQIGRRRTDTDGRRSIVSPSPRRPRPGRDRPEPHIRLLPSAFSATAGGAPASPEAAYRRDPRDRHRRDPDDRRRRRIVAHNAAACRMFGYGSDDLLGANFATLVPEADRFSAGGVDQALRLGRRGRRARHRARDRRACTPTGACSRCTSRSASMGRRRRAGCSRASSATQSSERSAALARAATAREREAFQRVTEAVATGVEPGRPFRLVARRWPSSWARRCA